MDYKSAGVNIEAGNRAVDLIKDRVKSTYTPHILSHLGSFAACCEVPKDLENPVMVSCTDGVGTKLMVAIEHAILDTVGIDLVAMNVNDLICCGAKPMFFLDYVACHQLNPDQMKLIIEGIVEGCLQAQCSLIGGEMAEMNDMYKKGDFDLAGFCVGLVDRTKMINGQGIQPGDYVYGLRSSGLHSNGFSLARKVLTRDICEKHGISPKQLLEPTKIYVQEVLSLISEYPIRGIAHITGGGLAENLVRALPENVSITIPKSKIPTPEIFKIIQQEGQVAEDEMYRVFNMGIGMVVVSAEKLPETSDRILLAQVESGSRRVSVL